MVPQIIYLVCLGIYMLAALTMHGSVTTKKENFWRDMCLRALAVGLLYWGGFFDCWIGG